MSQVVDVLSRKLKEHSRLSRTDIAALEGLSIRTRLFKPNEDIVRQGEKPENSAVVVTGTVARYHTLPNGKRQYISFHIAGDLPDVQAVFIEEMDHAVCAMNEALIGLIQREQLAALFKRRPELAFVCWRETLIDAAIFREAVTNNSSRPPLSRVAHFFCEQYYRARVSELNTANSCSLPIVQGQLGEALGLSLISVSRTLRELREKGLVTFERGVLTVHDWKRLAKLGEFDPSYLHLGRAMRM